MHQRVRVDSFEVPSNIVVEVASRRELGLALDNDGDGLLHMFGVRDELLRLVKCVLIVVCCFA